MTFRVGRVFIKPSHSKVAKQIGVRHKSMYILQFEIAATLTSRGSPDSRGELGELWHRCMGHLLGSASKIHKEIVIGLPHCNMDQHEVCKGRTLGKYAKTPFPSRDSKAKGFGPCSFKCLWSFLSNIPYWVQVLCHFHK